MRFKSEKSYLCDCWHAAKPANTCRQLAEILQKGGNTCRLHFEGLQKSGNTCWKKKGQMLFF